MVHRLFSTLLVMIGLWTCSSKKSQSLCSGEPIELSLFLARACLVEPGNIKGGSITVPLTSCFTGLDQYVLQIKTKIVSCHTADSRPVKLEANSTVILPPLVFPGGAHVVSACVRHKNFFSYKHTSLLRKWVPLTLPVIKYQPKFEVFDSKFC